jgi:tetratricopeptide (TPR) repeat protein/predicted Ser/Thr protein kinase
MNLTCPHCQCLIERSGGDAAAEIPCPACGQAFRLDQGETAPAATCADRRHFGPVVIGQVLSHYHILEPLGGGGMGVVYKAQDTRLGRSVALKFLPQEYARDPQRLERFQREARTASALNHPHICTIYDIDEHEGQPFLVMELIEGQTLRSLAARRPSLPELVHLVGHVAKALAAAHAAGIMHRDIKPDNIMVRDDGYAKVVDFGLARPIRTVGQLSETTAAELTEPGTVLGTVRYMSPEQARAEAAEGASDLFSLGIVLYELVTGEHPFPADSPIGTLHAILSQPALRPSLRNPEVPAALEALILQMLEKDPRLRPTALEVDATLAELTGKGTGSLVGPAPIPLPRHTVGRQNELAELQAGFESVVAGRGLFLCVTGEPGVGKTTVVEEFLAGLAAAGRTCTVGRGRCSERLAGAEAYLPLLEVLESLLHGIGGEAVARVMKVVAPNWYAQVVPHAAEDSSFARVLEYAKAASQERLKRELAAVLQELSRLRPLLLFLDDLHWADASTVDLLAYIGSKCPALPLLMVLTYRPTDLLLNKHPFVPLKQDFQARGVCREVALELLIHHDVERFLALEFPQHRFPGEVAALIHAKTEGNPLFMVDLLRHLRDLQVLAQEQGRWVLARSLPDLERELPESVRSMIERKIDQLGEEDRRVLVAASVQGPEFEAAVVARALALDAAEVEEQLGRLERVHAFVRLVGEHELPDRTLTLRYRFVHVLYQDALYGSLRPARRASLSGAAAKALAGYHGEKSAAVAGELASLWEGAREFARAADCYLQAAENAARLFANREVVLLARRGLDLLEALPESPERARQELALQIALGPALMAVVGKAAPGVERAYTRAQALCQQLSETPQLFPALWGLWFYYLTASEVRTAQALGGQLLNLAERADEPALLLEAHHALGTTHVFMGDWGPGQAHLDQGIALYDPQQHRAHALLYGGHDPGVCCRCFSVWGLWMLGFPDQALARSQEALTLARELSDPTTLAHAQHLIGWFHQFRRDATATRQLAEMLERLSAEQGLSTYGAGGSILRGWALAAGSQADEGITRIRQGLVAMATSAPSWHIPSLALLADAYGRGGKVQEGLDVLVEALAAVEDTGVCCYEPEMHRLKGELLLARAQGNRMDAEACFRQAVDIARRQGAKTLELRAVLSLSHLYHQQGKKEAARGLLAEIYGWFTEGFDTEDLQEAKALLQVIS